MRGQSLNDQSEWNDGMMSGSGYFDYGDMSPGKLFRSRNSGLQELILAAETVEEETPLKPNGRRVRIKWCVSIITNLRINLRTY